ncbi:subtilisin family serine protease [Actinoplanes lutulentus]|uniref:Subtilisin family serine protease n=1 Tax=Actinoplanes lutulentus TaxID=1287878 RepID=A0A327ZLY1_9ACTN|nr:S8 family serine peptidase [Actinoplanes lutulentus]MBB2941126.1 subtilisin family serine protease [Actinoplanes lutulentus]RAK43435.1 subtilisin family serine protease [Actinoplanes lutulentus]
MKRVGAGLVLPAALVATGLAAPAAHAAGDGTDVESRKRAAAAAGATPRRVETPESSTVNLIVGGSASASSLGFASKGNASLDRLGVRVVSVPRAEAGQAAAKLRATAGVTYVEEDAVVTADRVTPNDPEWSGQTELPQITLPDAWSSTTGSGLTVAVVDTGVTSFDDIAGRVLSGYDFVNKDTNAVDDEGHGTSVASLIAAQGNNGKGMAGTCWSCKILPVKVLDANGSGYQSTVASGIIYAADKGAKIINASLGGTANVAALRDAVAYAQRKGSLVIASAGNDAVSTPHYPAAYPGVIGVGGTDESSDWYFNVDIIDGYYFYYGSNYGPSWVDVAAPWCTIAANLAGFGNSTTADDYRSDFCGTSASAPLVSGVLALMKSKAPKASNTALVNSLTRTARPTETTGFSQYGEIRAARAVTSIDTTAPRIAGSSPAQNKRFRGAITVTAGGVSDSGGSGLSHAILYANGKQVGRDNTAPYSLRYNSGKANGNVNLQWRVFDKAGNYGVYNRRVIADNKAPAVKITSAPKNGKKVKGTVTVKVAASDASGIARVELYINGKLVKKDASKPYTFKIKVSKYGKKLKIKIRAVDKVGNTRTTATRTWKR